MEKRNHRKTLQFVLFQMQRGSQWRKSKLPPLLPEESPLLEFEVEEGQPTDSSVREQPTEFNLPETVSGPVEVNLPNHLPDSEIVTQVHLKNVSEVDNPEPNLAEPPDCESINNLPESNLRRSILHRSPFKTFQNVTLGNSIIYVVQTLFLSTFIHSVTVS